MSSRLVAQREEVQSIMPVLDFSNRDCIGSGPIAASPIHRSKEVPF